MRADFEIATRRVRTPRVLLCISSCLISCSPSPPLDEPLAFSRRTLAFSRRIPRRRNIAPPIRFQGRLPRRLQIFGRLRVAFRSSNSSCYPFLRIRRRVAPYFVFGRLRVAVAFRYSGDFALLPLRERHLRGSPCHRPCARSQRCSEPSLKVRVMLFISHLTGVRAGANNTCDGMVCWSLMAAPV